MSKNIIFVTKEDFEKRSIVDRFIFFSKSAKKKPGEGKDEFISVPYDLPLDFRQKLSNFAESELEYDGSELGIGSGLDSQKKRKSIILQPEQLELWDIKKDKIMYELWNAKFTQNSELKTILIGTKNAELWHTVNRKPIKQHWVGLEKLRILLNYTS